MDFLFNILSNCWLTDFHFKTSLCKRLSSFTPLLKSKLEIDRAKTKMEKFLNKQKKLKNKINQCLSMLLTSRHKHRIHSWLKLRYRWRHLTSCSNLRLPDYKRTLTLLLVTPKLAKAFTLFNQQTSPWRLWQIFSQKYITFYYIVPMY